MMLDDSWMHKGQKNMLESPPQRQKSPLDPLLAIRLTPECRFAAISPSRGNARIYFSDRDVSMLAKT